MALSQEDLPLPAFPGETARVEAWAREPGARVQGHRAVLVSQDNRYRVTCECGLSSLDHALPDACLLLLSHLEEMVRGGASVLPGEDGPAGVREPRRPLPPTGGAAVALEPH